MKDINFGKHWDSNKDAIQDAVEDSLPQEALAKLSKFVEDHKLSADEYVKIFNKISEINETRKKYVGKDVLPKIQSAFIIDESGLRKIIKNFVSSMQVDINRVIKQEKMYIDKILKYKIDYKVDRIDIQFLTFDDILFVFQFLLNRRKYTFSFVGVRRSTKELLTPEKPLREFASPLDVNQLKKYFDIISDTILDFLRYISDEWGYNELINKPDKIYTVINNMIYDDYIPQRTASEDDVLENVLKMLDMSKDEDDDDDDHYRPTKRKYSRSSGPSGFHID